MLLTGAIVLLAASQLRYLGIWESWMPQVRAASPTGASRAWSLVATISFSWWLLLQIWDDFAQGRKSGLSVQRLLIFWVIFSVIGAVFGSPFPGVRYVLLGVPAVVIMAVRDLNLRLPKRIQLTATAAVIFATAWLGILVTDADMKHAACIRDLTVLAADIVHKEKAKGFLGGHWGSQYYGERMGLRTASILEAGISPGDIVIYPQNASRQTIKLPDGLTASPLAILRCQSGSAFLSTMSQIEGSGFYGCGWIPYAFGRRPLDALELKRIVLRNSP